MKEKSVYVEQKNFDETYKQNLLRCAVMALLVTEDCPIVHDYQKIYLDYKTNEKFNAEDPKTLARTMRDFAKIFIRPKSEKKYTYFIKKLTNTFFCVDVHEKLENQLDKQQKFVEDMFKAGGIDKRDRERIRKMMLDDFNAHKRKTKYGKLPESKYKDSIFDKKQDEKANSNRPKIENSKVSDNWKDNCSIW